MRPWAPPSCGRSGRSIAATVFAGLCAALETDGDADSAAREMGAILLRWIEDGLLAR